MNVNNASQLIRLKMLQIFVQNRQENPCSFNFEFCEKSVQVSCAQCRHEKTQK